MLATPLPANQGESDSPVAAILLEFYFYGVLEQVWFRGARLETADWKEALRNKTPGW